MTDAWDGLPPNPERDGWHWLLERYRWCRPEAVEWCSEPGVWRGKGPASAAVGQEVRYLGPCLTPAEVEARVAAARRGGIEAALRVCRAAAMSKIHGSTYHQVATMLEDDIRALLTEGGR